jgi:inorganic pyrophosphatase
MVLRKYALLLLIVMFSSCKNKIDYYHLPVTSSDNSFNAVIEIPGGTNKKYEYNKRVAIY